MATKEQKAATAAAANEAAAGTLGTGVTYLKSLNKWVLDSDANHIDGTRDTEGNLTQIEVFVGRHRFTVKDADDIELTLKHFGITV